MKFDIGRATWMLALVLAALADGAPALAAETIAVTPEDVGSIQTLDEVVVTGKLDSLSAAKKAVVAAENRFYSRYNQLNKDDALDITCRVEARTGTRIQKRICQPRMVDEFTRIEALPLQETGNGSMRLRSAAALQAELKAHTLKLLDKDEELLRALLERARLEQYYIDLRARKFRNRLVVWD